MMRNWHTGVKTLFIASAVLPVFWVATIFAAPAEDPPGGQGYIQADPDAPAGSLVIDSLGDISAGVWRGTLLDSLYGGTGLSVSNSNAVRTGLGMAGAGANGDISSLLGTGGPFLLNPAGNVGIGNASPSTSLSVGSSGGFKVDSAGDIKAIKGVPYSWPAIQGGSSSILMNEDGSGKFIWYVLGSGGTAGGWTEDPFNTKVYATDTDHNVGIGTITPESRLDVLGNIGLSDGAFIKLRVPPAASQPYIHSGSSSSLGSFFAGYFVGLNGLTGNGVTGQFTNTTAIGSYALIGTDGNRDAAVGYSALRSQTSTGSSNTAVGASAIDLILDSQNVMGSNNTAAGYSALKLRNNLDNNVAVGYNAGNTSTSAGGATYVGYEAKGGAALLANASGIGASAVPADSNLIVLGNGNAKVGIGTSAPTQLFSVGPNAFQVNSDGDIVKINDLSYAWPGDQGGASSVLTMDNSATGALAWHTTSSDGSVGGWQDNDVNNNATYVNATAKNVGINSSVSNNNDKFTIKAIAGMAALSIRNTTDTAPTFTISDAGTVTAGSVPWTRLIVFCNSGDLLKSLGASALTCATPPASTNGWTEVPGNNKIYTTNTSRKVGIGTASPLEKLHLKSPNAITTTTTSNPLSELNPPSSVLASNELNNGYRFTPLVNGSITQLGAKCDPGQRTVSLYNDSGGAPLASVDVITTDSSWAYADISAGPVNVTAGTSYVVAVRNFEIDNICPTGDICLNPGTQQSYCGGSFSTPITSPAGNLVINEGRTNTAGGDFPTVASNSVMHGLADVTFEVETNSADSDNMLIVSGKAGIGEDPAGFSEKLVVAGTVASSSIGLMFPGGAVQSTAALTGNSGTANTLVNRSSPPSNMISSSVADNGNIGIGVSSPTSKFQVAGDVQVSNNANSAITCSGACPGSLYALSTPSAISVGMSGLHHGAISAFSFWSDTAKSAFYGNVPSGTAAGIEIAQNGTGDIASFYDNLTRVFTVFDGGNVGIGSSSNPPAKLEVLSATQSAMRIKKTAGTAGSVDLFPAVGDATALTGTALCQTVSSTAVCLSHFSSDGTSYGVSNPLKDNDPNTPVLVSGTITGGYSFKLQTGVKGKITHIGVRCPSTALRPLRLYDYTVSGSPVLLASFSISPQLDGTWTYATLTPAIDIDSTNKTYLVSVGPGTDSTYCYSGFNTSGSGSFPTSGGIDIITPHSTNGANVIPAASSWSGGMHGEADIIFDANVYCSTSLANTRALCADFGD